MRRCNFLIWLALFCFVAANPKNDAVNPLLDEVNSALPVVLLSLAPKVAELKKYGYKDFLKFVAEKVQSFIRMNEEIEKHAGSKGNLHNEVKAILKAIVENNQVMVQKLFIDIVMSEQFEKVKKKIQINENVISENLYKHGSSPKSSHPKIHKNDYVKDEIYEETKEHIIKKLKTEFGVVENGKLSDNLMTTIKLNFAYQTGKRLRIAQIGTLYYRIPPQKYGGSERIISYLTEQLVKDGHDVTLFAAKGSKTSGKLVAEWSAANFDEIGRDSPVDKARNREFLESISKMAHQFDILHFHGFFGFDRIIAMMEEAKAKGGPQVVYTHHVLLKPKYGLHAQYNAIPMISISNHQKYTYVEPNGKPNIVGTVHHGIEYDHLQFMPNPQGVEGGKAGRPYVAFLGRFVWEKRADLAIRIALKTDYDIRLAAKIEKPLDHYEQKVKPLIDANPGRVHYEGEISDEEKGCSNFYFKFIFCSEFLGNAVAMLFPVEWPEPFGMVLVESMACGTPVVARNIGSIPEIVENGVTGYIFNGGNEERIAPEFEEKFIENAVEALKKAVEIDRHEVRKEFMQRFTVEKMARGYEKIYYERIELAKEGGGS